MIICGVDISGKSANLAIVRRDEESNLSHVLCEIKKLMLENDTDAEQLVTLKKSIKAFAQSHGVEMFVIKSRLSRGPMASGGTTFKIEALIQLSGVAVEFVAPKTLSTFRAKKNQAGMPETVKRYQEDAYLAGAWRLSQS